MLYYNSDCSWENISDGKNDLINLYYNLIQVKRFVMYNRYAFFNNYGFENKSFSFFKKKTNNDIELPIPNLDIIAANYRIILDNYNLNTINDLDTLFTRINDFTDFILFLNKIDRVNKCEASEKESTKSLTIGKFKIDIESTVIPKTDKYGSILLNMLDGIDNYISIYSIYVYDELKYKIVSGEEFVFDNIEDKILFTRYTDNLINSMYIEIRDTMADMVDFNDTLDYKLISDNLAKGKIYVRKQ